jgi:hypothetical protein
MRSDANRARKYGDRIHSDLWGPAQVNSIDGMSYYVSFTDETTAFTEIHFLKKKSDTLKAYRTFTSHTKTQKNNSIKELHCDGGGEYYSHLFNDFLNEQGTKRTASVHDTHEQNGISERLNGILVGNA